MKKIRLFPVFGRIVSALPRAAVAVACCLSGYATGAPAPIKVGAITSISSGAPLPESIEGVLAYFELVNSAGGIQGRKLQLFWEDDGGDPERARQIAQRLVEVEGVVAMVGSSSIVDCSSNGAYYQKRGAVSIPGTGVEYACFNSPAIAPVNAGPYAGLTTALKFASKILHHERICVVLMDFGGMAEGYQEAIGSWSRQTGKKLADPPMFLKVDTHRELLLGRIAETGCQSVAFTGLEGMVQQWMDEVKRRRVNGPDWIFMTPAYTADVARGVGEKNGQVYVMSEFMPWTTRSLDLMDWREAMSRRKGQLSSFSQGGYIAGQVFVHALKSLKGEISRDSVRQSFLRQDKIDNNMLGAPYRFGQGLKHNPNRTTLPMRLQGGSWRIAHIDWISADSGNES